MSESKLSSSSKQNKSSSSLSTGVEVVPRENLFGDIARGLKQSVHHLPGPMMIILVFAATIAVLLGVFIQVMGHRSAESNAYLALRLDVDASKRVVNADLLRGVWVYSDTVQTMTIHFGVNGFELIRAPKGADNVRYFIRGDFKVVGNVLILQARNDLGTPFDERRLNLTFLPIEMQGLNIVVEQSQNMMLWRIPVSERTRFTPTMNESFPLADTRPMAFVRIANR